MQGRTGTIEHVPTAVDPRAYRWVCIDALKAYGIITVIWIHCFQILGAPPTDLGARLGFATRFAVPAFLFASGFLAQRAVDIPWREFVRRRLQRLLLPYLVATACTLAYQAMGSRRLPSVAEVTYQVLTASAWGAYYFILILTGAFLLLTPLFRRWPRLALPTFGFLPMDWGRSERNKHRVFLAVVLGVP